MRMTVKPQQINAGGGGIGVWLGLHSQPTYLLAHKTEKNIAAFVTFASVAWAEEWFEQNPEYGIVWKFEPGQEK